MYYRKGGLGLGFHRGIFHRSKMASLRCLGSVRVDEEKFTIRISLVLYFRPAGRSCFRAARAERADPNPPGVPCFWMLIAPAAGRAPMKQMFSSTTKESFHQRNELLVFREQFF